ncbi:MAG TPA: 2OG-Fe(II) oxygenase [Xanthobacteraceae bacterium]|nr:2OG-Fe(II) oxygenase [Xanthobacteraceae bacterium]
MSQNGSQTPIVLGDPVPWFSAKTITGASVELQINAGRWIVLAFFGAMNSERAVAELGALLQSHSLFVEDRLMVFVVLTEPSPDEDVLKSFTSPAFSFIADFDRSLTRLYGALGAPRTFVVDPMLRTIADIAWDHTDGHAATVAKLLTELPDVDRAAGVPITAPALIVPRVFEFPFCEMLVNFYEDIGGAESGFLLDRNGKTKTVVDHRYKCRHDLAIVEPNLRDAIRDRIVRRLVPEIARFFQFKATRMDRYMVSCYDSATGGHFSRHRDNVNAGARHRRFAASINLNSDYEGSDLIFPEFGRRIYKAPVGGAIVFSCGALHQVTPVTRGKRYAFVPFFYGEADAALRMASNAHLKEGEIAYTGERDKLFPAVEALGIVPEMQGEHEKSTAHK